MMFCTHRNSRQIRQILVSGCSFVSMFAGFGSHALAGDTGVNPATTYAPVYQGSAPTHRSVTDTFSGQVNIYAGGSLRAGTHLAKFQYLFDETTEGNTTGYITPLLFEYRLVEGFTVFTVVGIGRSFEVKKLSSIPQTIPFQVIAGIAVPTGGNFTFGFTTAIVDASGVTLATSPGVVDFDTPADGGQGAGGPLTTNNWYWTVGEPGPPPAVALGTTFGPAGAIADYELGLPYRTYSAQAIGVLAAQ